MIRVLMKKFGYIHISELDHAPTRSLDKRISEQKEIEEFIMSQCSDATQNKPWVMNWLSSQREYLKHLKSLQTRFKNDN